MTRADPAIGDIWFWPVELIAIERQSGQSPLSAMSTTLSNTQRGGAAIVRPDRGVSVSFWRDVLYCDHSKRGWSSRQCGVGFHGSSTRPSRRLAHGRSVACSDCPQI